MNTGVPWPKPLVEAELRLPEIQTKLHQWAIDHPHRRFNDLFNRVAHPAFPTVAWNRVAHAERNRIRELESHQIRQATRSSTVASVIGEIVSLNVSA